MKQITITKCGGCHNCRFDGRDSLRCDITGKATPPDEIHKDCPLREMPSREEARRILTIMSEETEVANTMDKVGEIIDTTLHRLGFTEKEGK